jgi:pyrroloquinoline quinone biosynthesis protein B
VLINASPDLPEQIRRSPALRPRGATRGSPIKAVVLTGAEIDQVTGLLSLRERETFALHATAEALALIEDNSVFGVLPSEVVMRRKIMPDVPFGLPGGLRAELFRVPGKAPLYVEGPDPETRSESAGTVGADISAGGTRIVFIPGAATVTPGMLDRMRGADVVFFDGTLFRDDEMVASGTGTKSGQRMGHMSIDGPDGSLAALARLRARRIYIHINNTNPILVDGSPERERVVGEGWEVAEDGLEISL